MGKKRRNTAKTGDTALYQSRTSSELASAKKRRADDSDDDAIYNEVDRFHNKREQEFIRFEEDGDGEEEEADDGITHGREGVFDLGVGGSSDEDASESSESEDGDGGGRGSRAEGSGGDDESISSEADVSVSSSDDDSDGEGAKTNVLDWGSRKSAYYHGDTADLEIGQDEEDAEVEEEAGREVVRARLEGMDEGDFLLDDDEESDEDLEEKSKEKKKEKKTGNTSDAAGIETIRSTDVRRREKLGRLSKSERIKLISRSHPEFLPLIEHFRDGAISELANETDVLCNALLEDAENAQAVGATPSGLQYLVTKAMLQTSTALNVCQYLLLKAESTASNALGGDDDEDPFGANSMGIVPDEDSVRNHPVITRLNQLNDLAEKLNTGVADKVPGIKEQVDSLVKAAALMKQEDGNERGEADGISEGEDDEETSNDNEGNAAAGTKRLMAGSLADYGAPHSDDESEEDSSSEEGGNVRRRVVTEAKFALRPQDIGSSLDEKRFKASHRRRLAPLSSDFGDEDGAEEAANAAGRALASTLNAISQRTDTKSKKGAMAVVTAPEEEDDENDERFMRGLEMMDADMSGSESDGEAGDEDDDVDDELDDGLDDDFYDKIKKKSKAKKDFKKGLYAVAPKYPVVEEEVEGERAISRAIMKNRGLVAHKSKLNRNPRVKKREQYRRALIRRKGAVREVRTDEGHKYGGEATGIKSGISRSRKLGVR